MGNTTASVHIAWRGNADVAAKAISRCYSKLGYERVKKALPEDGKHVVLLARPGQSYVSIYDSENAKLDNGELKDLALAASKALRAPAVFTSLYDSDSYEFIVFFNGRQIDLLMTDAENYEGPLKRLSDKARPAKWNSIFSRTLNAEQINAAAAPESVFADSVIAGLSELIGLRHGQPQMNYQDFLDEPNEITAEFHFKKKTKANSELQASDAGAIRLTDYFDAEQSFLRSVYPAAFPIPVRHGCGARWLALSQGAGFTGGIATIQVSGPETLTLSKAIIAGCKFHNGQIVGKLETYPKIVTQEEAAAFAESQKFSLIPLESSSAGSREYRGEFPSLIVPPMTPERTTQILLLIGLDLHAETAGEWEINFSIQPGMQTEMQHHLPPVRIAALEQGWLPVISGLNPKTTYDKSNLSPNHQREMDHNQSRIPLRRRLDHPAITSSVAILNDEGQPTLDACKAWFEAWLRPLADQREGDIRIHAEKQMSAAAYVGKTKKTIPVFDFLADKLWTKLFDDSANYQTVLVSFVPKNGDHPVAGIGLQHSFKRHEEKRTEYAEQQIAKTLSAMRGRPFDPGPPGDTWHVFKWVINHQDCYGCLGTSATEMEQQLDIFAAQRAPLQAWSSQCTWIPVFDSADSFERTLYEESSTLNWFRGILNTDHGLNDAKMTAHWCSNVLRMVAPHMWLCRSLIDQVDKAALEHVAEISEANGVYKLALRRGFALDDLELALLPILPVENSRISVVV